MSGSDGEDLIPRDNVWLDGPLEERHGPDHTPHGPVADFIADPPEGADLEAVCLADVEPEEVQYLWRPRIPLGKLTILEGDPGQGKSFLSCAVAAAVSSGVALPGDSASKPGAVLILTAEDGIADTLRKRLDSLEADVGKIFVSLNLVDLSKIEGRERLADLIKRQKPVLVIIDPITAYVGPGTDTHRANQVRGVLAPLAKIAERWKCSVLVVRHLAKSPGGRAIYRGLGSIDFTAAARSVLLAGSPPSDPESRALVHIKCNVAKLAPSLGYRIFEVGNEARFEWTGESSLGSADLLAEEQSYGQQGRIEEAREFLRETLEDGPVAASEMKEQAKKAGIAQRTLDEAKRREGVKSSKKGFKDGRWYWYYPSGEGQQENPA